MQSALVVLLKTFHSELQKQFRCLGNACIISALKMEPVGYLLPLGWTKGRSGTGLALPSRETGILMSSCRKYNYH